MLQSIYHSYTDDLSAPFKTVIAGDGKYGFAGGSQFKIIVLFVIVLINLLTANLRMIEFLLKFWFEKYLSFVFCNPLIISDIEARQNLISRRVFNINYNLLIFSVLI